MKWILAAAIVGFSVMSAKSAELAVCGASDGYAYYPKFGLAATDPEAGTFVRDPISEGRITLTQLSEKEFDILITDATGAVFSSTQEGAAVVVVPGTKTSLSFIVLYPDLTETYSFFRNSDGDAEVVWTSNKWGTPIKKAGAYRAKCGLFAVVEGSK